MARRLIPYARLGRDGRLPLNPFLWYPKGEKERARIVAELLSLLGTGNPNSSLHSEHDPRESDSRLYLAVSVLPLDFARKVLDYAKSVNQRERDILQMSLRYLRSAEDTRPVLTASRVNMVETYLNAMPLFEALAGGDLRDMGRLMVNHAENTHWEAHRSHHAREHPKGYFLYTVVWPKTPLPDRDTIAWLDTNAIKLAKLRIGQRGAFDRGFCEVLLASSTPAVSSGAL